MRRLFRLWRLGGRDLGILFAALRNPNRPAWLLPATLALVFFALDPFNFAIPFLGVVDDLIVLPLLLRALAALATPARREQDAARNARVVSVQ
jgi:uncharacterized membrane protein YkvA (DUF1232 family)